MPNDTKWRKWNNSPALTGPLVVGCNASKHNLVLIDEIDALGLDREKALVCDADGKLSKVFNYMDFKLTPEEIEEERRDWERLLNKD